MIEITIKLETDKVEEAIKKAWQREFRSPERESYPPDLGGAGWQAVVRQIEQYIETIDLSKDISRHAKAKLENIVDEAVTQALRDKARQRAKAMMKDGTLLQ